MSLDNGNRRRITGTIAAVFLFVAWIVIDLYVFPLIGIATNYPLYELVTYGSWAIIALLCFLLLPQTSYADIPETINFQGRLRGSAGQLVTGTYNMTFRIYDAPSGGTPLWEESQAVYIDDVQFSMGGLGQCEPDGDIRGSRIRSDARQADSSGKVAIRWK